MNVRRITLLFCASAIAGIVAAACGHKKSGGPGPATITVNGSSSPLPAAERR